MRRRNNCLLLVYTDPPRVGSDVVKPFGTTQNIGTLTISSSKNFGNLLLEALGFIERSMVKLISFANAAEDSALFDSAGAIGYRLIERHS